MIKTLSPDLFEKGFEYHGQDENGKIINPYVESGLIDLSRLIGSLGPDDSQEIERFSTSNLAPKRNVQKDYFNKLIKEYVGLADVKKDKLDEYIAIIRKYLGDKEAYMATEVTKLVKRSKDIPNKLANTLVRILNGKDETNLLNYEEEQKLKNLYTAFNRRSIGVLGKNVKYKQSVLFHLLRKIGKEPDMNDFYFQGSESVKKTDKEIKKVFDKLGWEFKLL